jgi:hypothetical protein
VELRGGVGRNDPVPLTCQDGNASTARAEEQTVSLPARTRTTAVTSAAGLGRRRRWAAGLAWGLWTLAILGLAVVPWLDSRLRQAGRPDLAAFVPSAVVGPILAMLSAATVGAVLASRRPRHPVGWLLLGFALALTASGVTSSYASYGLLARPGALPAANVAARLYPVTIAAALAVVGFVLLLTPTGSPPSSRWRRWPWALAVAVAVVLVAATVAPGSLDPLAQFVSPMDPQVYGGALRVAVQLALLAALLTVLAGAGSLVARFRRARGVERLQLQWVALAAGLTGLSLLATAVLIAVGEVNLGNWASAFGVAFLPLATGAAILRYRLYDLDRIISRTLAYGLLTVLLGLGYALVVLGLGRLVSDEASTLAVAGATLAVAAAFQPLRRRVQGLVDRRFNRRRYDAAATIEAFSGRLHEQVDLDTLTAELLALVDQTMQPTCASLWLRPSLTTPAGRR